MIRNGPESVTIWHKPVVFLLDHLIRPPEERRRDRQAEGLRGLEVDHQLELGGLLDGEIAGLGALEDLVDVDGGMAKLVGVVRAIAGQAPRFHIFTGADDGR
jgi:hypothetical protein